MSTVIRSPDGTIKLYTKGADTVILERLSRNQPFTEMTLSHLEVRRSYFFFLSGHYLWYCNRIMQRRGCGHFASPIAKFPKQSTRNGLISMTRPQQLSMDAEMPWMPPPS